MKRMAAALALVLLAAPAWARDARGPLDVPDRPAEEILPRRAPAATSDHERPRDRRDRRSDDWSWRGDERDRGSDWDGRGPWDDDRPDWRDDRHDRRGDRHDRWGDHRDRWDRRHDHDREEWQRRMRQLPRPSDLTGDWREDRRHYGPYVYGPWGAQPIEPPGGFAPGYDFRRDGRPMR
ncbi:hypothetical protein [Consotaella salsifontis]|nr:hypothetical protein [Consotaella salsifontis]